MAGVPTRRAAGGARLARAVPRAGRHARRRSRARSQRSSPRGRRRPRSAARASGSRAISGRGSSGCGGERSRAEARAEFLAEVEAASASFDLVAPSAAALPARRHAAPRLRRTRAARRRDGPRQDRAGDRRLRAARPPQGHRARAGGLPGLAQGGVGGADRALHRPSGALRVRRRGRSALPPIASRPSSTSSTTSRCSADADDINALLAPDVVVLDEAQRIKNWQTKTARRVKRCARPMPSC